MNKYPFVQGTGLGLRRAFISTAADHDLTGVDFMELAPENWIDVGGKFGRLFSSLVERVPFVCHGLSLNLGGPAPLDESLLRKIKLFLDQHKIDCYSEHLSYCADDGHLYDLMPIPFTEEAVKYVAARIRRASDILDRKIAIENISYYAAPDQVLSEREFINAVLAEADCDLLIDINNIYVNSINHGYDARAFLMALPSERIAYAHIAGHYKEAEDLIVDTHGSGVIESVWDLLRTAYQHFGVFPTLLERDFNIPSLAELLEEVSMIRAIQREHVTARRAKKIG